MAWTSLSVIKKHLQDSGMEIESIYDRYIHWLGQLPSSYPMLTSRWEAKR